MMADKKKKTTKDTEKKNKDEKLDTLNSLLLDDDNCDSGSDDEADFDSFMAEYREILGKKQAQADNATIEQDEIEEEKPEEVLISLPDKLSKSKKEQPEIKKPKSNPDWDEKITLEPEEYDDPYEDEKQLIEETVKAPAEAIICELGEIGEENDDDFQISINFDGEADSQKDNEEDTDEVNNKYDPDNPRPIDWVFDIVEMFVFVLVAVMLLTSFVFKHSIVEGQSMMNTLEDGDHLIISNLFYTPERGDIVVFEDYSTSLKKAVVKRVIGLPGDTVEVRMNEDGDVTVYINGELLEEEYAFNARDCNIDVSSFNKPITIEDGEIFVMGDNRYHSTDSRTSSVGPVSIDSILGKAVFRFLPFDKFGVIGD